MRILMLRAVALSLQRRNRRFSFTARKSIKCHIATLVIMDGVGRDCSALRHPVKLRYCVNLHCQSLILGCESRALLRLWLSITTLRTICPQPHDEGDSMHERHYFLDRKSIHNAIAVNQHWTSQVAIEESSKCIVK